MNKVVPLRRDRPKREDNAPIMAFDMETEGLGGAFIICAFLSDTGERHISYDLEDVFSFMRDNPQYRYLAHNASGYEFAYLYPIIKSYFDRNSNVEIRPTLQGDTRVVQFLIYRDGKMWLDIRDTLCLFGMSLANVAKSYCPGLPKLTSTIDFDREVFNPAIPDHMSYLWRDVEIIVSAYNKLRSDIRLQFGANIGVTAGRTAMNAFQASIDKGKSYYRVNKHVEKFVREGYYGGAVFPGHSIGNWGPTLGADINGAYAYNMGANPYPVGAACRTVRYIDNTLGMYKVIATVPSSVFDDLGFNPIPCRDGQGLSWPSGVFETTITSMEYDYGIRHGCSFVIIEGYVWFRQEFVFKDFVAKCQELELANNGAFKPTVKLIRNSLYGKFGSKPVHEELVFSHEVIKDAAIKPLINRETGEQIEDVYTKEALSESVYMLPHWAAFTTAYERLYLFGFMEDAYRRGASDVYCDTDSIKAHPAIIQSMVQDGTIQIGNKYGELKLEELVNEFIVLGPKVYYGQGEEGDVIKCKGIPRKKLSGDTFRDAAGGKFSDVPFESVLSVRNIIKSNKNVQPIRRKRKITDIRNSYAWNIQTPQSVINSRIEIKPRGYVYECQEQRT